MGYYQIIEVFSRKGIYVLSETVRAKYDEEIKKSIWTNAEKIKNFIDSNIESGLLVMILGEFVRSDEKESLLEHSI